jgi:hypothetical protein
MNFAAIGRRLVAFEHAVIADDAGDPQAIIGEDAAAAGLLGCPVRLEIAPLLHRRLVSEKGERQQFAAGRQALETFDRDEAVDRFEIGAQLAGEIQIFMAFAHIGHDFEDDGDHGSTSLA